jgi:lysozyme family protein
MNNIIPLLTFAWACDQILVYEGSEYTDDPDDAGGPTKWGVTLEDYRENINPQGTANDIKNLSRDTAIQDYKLHYWDPIKGDDLPFYMAFLIFDFGVNSGIGHAVKYAQAVMNITQDGSVGPVFEAAAAAFNPTTFIEQFSAAKETFYRGLGNFWKYGSGWLSRAETSKALATAIVTEFGAAKVTPDDTTTEDTPDVAQGDLLVKSTQ